MPCARSLEFYQTTSFWQWMRMPGGIVFALGALLMAWDFVAKLRAQRRTSEPASGPGGVASPARAVFDRLDTYQDGHPPKSDIRLTNATPAAAWNPPGIRNVAGHYDGRRMTRDVEPVGPRTREGARPRGVEYVQAHPVADRR